MIVFGIKSFNSIKQKFDNKIIYNKTFLKTKIKSYRDEVTNFPDKEMPKVVQQ